jgi:hypothetical protein
MATDVTPQPLNSSRPGADRLGARVAIATAIAGVFALAGAITTPPRSGVFCTSACITYPYTDVAAFVPRDYLWMYPALLLVVLFVILAVCIHHAAAPDVRVLSGSAVALSVIAATAIVVDYGIQLAVLQASLAKGETEGLTLFSMYNPHGMFIALEDVGYLLLGVAFLFAARAIPRGSRLGDSIRWLFTAGGALTVAALILLSLRYRTDLDYRFEVTAIFINWLVLIVSGLLLNRQFARRVRAGHQGSPEPTVPLG